MTAAARWPAPVREALGLWAVGFAALALATLLFGGTSVPKIVATVGFLYLPLWAMRKRDEDYRDYGVTLRAWREDLRLFLVLSAIVFPLYFGAYWAWAELVPHLPEVLAKQIAPFRAVPHFSPRLPARFPEWVVDQLFVVALPEEFFYRGFMQQRLRAAWPEGRTVLGVRLGRAFWVTAALFALGHLAIFQTWRLAVFFPALLFGWMRERTGTVVGATLFHAACNLYARVLDASFFGVG